MLRCWIGNISLLPTEADKLPLSEYRLSRLRLLRPMEKRRQSIGAELLLIEALRDLYGTIQLPLEIESEPGGKPSLRVGFPFFSLSHSGAYAACAVCDRPVGLDLQERRPCREELLGRFFAPAEREYIENARDRDAAFTELWCRKESWLKADGAGLSRPLASFSVLDPAISPRIWHSRIGELYLAVCAVEGDPKPDFVRQIELP